MPPDLSRDDLPGRPLSAKDVQREMVADAGRSRGEPPDAEVVDLIARQISGYLIHTRPDARKLPDDCYPVARGILAKLERAGLLASQQRGVELDEDERSAVLWLLEMGEKMLATPGRLTTDGQALHRGIASLLGKLRPGGR